MDKEEETKAAKGLGRKNRDTEKKTNELMRLKGTRERWIMRRKRQEQQPLHLLLSLLGCPSIRVPCFDLHNHR